MWNSYNCLQNGIVTLACIPALYKLALGIAINLIGIVSLFMIIFAGIKYTTSGGGKQVEEAKNILTYAIIGLVVALLAVFIIHTVAGLTGVGCIMTFGLFGPGTCKG
ncbi:MAG TPA: hypothetical protein VEW42_05035, partial [Candidatus Eisenbacteria bacterium]|nr:hypothetical protein [Candidatus Eisenbacteria bacterium]